MNEKGITLLEVMASIVLLSIILLSFFSFFIQGKKFERFNEAAYTATQLSEELVYLVENKPVNLDNQHQMWNDYFQTETPDTEDYFITINHRNYYPTVEEITSNPLVERGFTLYRISIFIEKEDEKKEVVKNYAIKKQ